VQLSPSDQERLRLFLAAELARRTLDRGLELNAPEAIALVCDEMQMTARSGASYEEVVAAGRAATTAARVLDGVAELVPEIRVEVLLDEGSRLVVLRGPFGSPSPGGPGAVRLAGDDVELVPDRERRRVSVTNAGPVPVRVSSHFPFWRTNPALEFDRDAARGFRLDLPAGDTVRWAPGESKEVELVAYAGTGAPGRGERA
jgi:urease subunit gamma/beta